MDNERRDFLKKGTLLGLVGLATTMVGKERLEAIEEAANKLGEATQFTLPALPYPYEGLEPFIDKQTMEIHHKKHHQAYVDNLNKAMATYKGDTSWKGLFAKVSKQDKAIRNNGGGHYNHSLFWTLMAPLTSSDKLVQPKGNLAAAIIKQYGSVEEFKKQFSEAATKLFGSGWCWLIVQNGKLKITTTPNQDNPLMDVAQEKGKPVLALDVWEHAYYLKFQNKRADYILNWWNIVNWDRAEELYNSK